MAELAPAVVAGVRVVGMHVANCRSDDGCCTLPGFGDCNDDDDSSDIAAFYCSNPTGIKWIPFVEIWMGRARGGLYVVVGSY